MTIRFFFAYKGKVKSINTIFYPITPTFCSCSCALTTRCSGDGVFWLATVSSVSANQVRRDAMASWNFPDCNMALSRFFSRSDTFALKSAQRSDRDSRSVSNPLVLDPGGADLMSAWPWEVTASNFFCRGSTVDLTKPCRKGRDQWVKVFFKAYESNSYSWKTLGYLCSIMLKMKSK